MPKDAVLAYMWFNLSVASYQGSVASYQGSVSAKYRDELAKTMTTVEIAEAQRLTREWKPQRSP